MPKVGVFRLLIQKTAAAKSLVAGNFTIRRVDGTFVSGLNVKEGILLPRRLDDDVINLSAIQWILIIEKEAFLPISGHDFSDDV
jgi:meiotic recombination protein SPO11